jgi:hypothetical protein
VNQTQDQYVATEQAIGVEGANFSGTVGSNTGSTARIDVSSLVTRSRKYGCRTWNGSYDMTNEAGGWRIVQANLTPQPC